MGGQPLYTLRTTVSQHDTVSTTSSDTFGIRTVTTRLVGKSPQAPDGARIFAVNGKEFVFRVLGDTNGGVYGTDVYTLDSSLPSAAVHAGVAKQGETVTVRVRILGPVPQFVSTTRNGITSSAYGQYAGFEFVRK